jgi:hypothetical protein
LRCLQFAHRLSPFAAWTLDYRRVVCACAGPLGDL